MIKQKIRYKGKTIRNCVVTQSFLKNKEDLMGVTDFVCFGRAVLGRELPRKVLRKRLHKLIDLEDYSEFTETEMLDHFG